MARKLNTTDKVELINSYDAYTLTMSGETIKTQETCALCGQHIRFVHVISVNGEEIKIGGTCAHNIAGTQNAESKMKKAFDASKKNHNITRIQKLNNQIAFLYRVGFRSNELIKAYNKINTFVSTKEQNQHIEFLLDSLQKPMSFQSK